MTPAVEGQVVRSRKTAVAVCAPERLDACVLTEMASKLIRASKFPGTAVPGALVRLLSCMDSAVSFQVRAFGVHFAASCKVTLMNPSSL